MNYEFAFYSLSCFVDGATSNWILLLKIDFVSSKRLAFLVSSRVIEFWKHFYGSDMIQVWQWKGNFDWGIDRISIKFKPKYDFCFTLSCLISLLKNFPNEKKLIKSKPNPTSRASVQTSSACHIKKLLIFWLSWTC